MSKVLRGLFMLVLLFSGAAIPAQALKNENLLLDIPDSKNYYNAWENKDRDARFLIVEYVPKGQTVHNWREMVTMTVNYKNMRITPKVYARKLMEFSKTECGGPIGNILKSGKLNGYAYALFFYGCAKAPVTGKSEWNLTVAIKGRDSFYSVSKAWVRKPTASAVSEWRNILGKAYVCDTRRPRNPCPGKVDNYISEGD